MKLSRNKKILLGHIAGVMMPVFGVLFLIWYVKAAGADVVYSDYFRIISEYLPDVGDITRLFTPDILTRVPAAFLARLINVRNFGYSVTFDRMLGIFGMVLMAAVLFVYMRRREIGLPKQLIIYIALFSLAKWEIILNGTAWTHIVCIGLFFINYYLAELLWKGETSAKEELLVLVMPILLLLIAGEYIASYAVTMMIISAFGILTGGSADNRAQQRTIGLFKAIFFTTALALAFYLVSRHFAVWEHAGMSDISLRELISEDPRYIPEFFFRSFTGAVVGQETAANFFGSGKALPDSLVTVLGVIIFMGYVIAFFIFIRTDLYEVTIFPAMLVISGFGNHLLVTIARWRFLDPSYGMSSRYAGQFMIGIIGMLIVFMIYSRQKRPLRGMSRSERSFIKGFVIFTTVLIVFGNCYTTYQEVGKAKYREENYTHMGEVMADYAGYEPETLAEVLEWHKDTDTLLEAIGILEENKLNIFK